MVIFIKIKKESGGKVKMNKIKQEIKMIECKSCKKPFKMKTRRINYHELNRLKKIKYNIIKWFKNVLNKRFFVNFQICYKCHKKLKKKKISCKNSGIVYWDNECGDICKFHPILNHYKHCIDCKNYSRIFTGYFFFF